MAEYYRSEDRERRRRDQDDDRRFYEEMRDNVPGWFRDEDRDRDRDWDRNRDWNRGQNRDLDRSQNWNRDQTRQWQSEQNYGGDYGRNTFGSRYGQNYPSGWRGDRNRSYDQDRDFDRNWNRDRERDWSRDRFSGEYGRPYDSGRMRTNFEDYDYDFDTGYDRQFRDQDRDWNQRRYNQRDFDRNYGYGRDYNRSQVSYSRGYENEPDPGRWRDYNQGSDWNRMSRGSRQRGQYRSAGMQSDFEGDTGRYQTGGMRSDYGQRYRDIDDYNRQDVNYSRGDIGYDSEGAFYQDLDEPYSYEYWEVWMVPGEFTGMGPQNYQRSDDRIFDNVCERLSQHGRIDASDMEIEVKDGEVTLKGMVPNREMKRLAEDTAESITGVKNINNEIKVRKHEQDRDMELGSSETSMGQSTSTFTGSTTGATGDDKKRQLREGMEVIGKNGKIVGRVKEVRNTDFLVDRVMSRDVYVPFNAVKSIGAQAQLTISADDIDNQDWEKPDVV